MAKLIILLNNFSKSFESNFEVCSGGLVVSVIFFLPNDEKLVSRICRVPFNNFSILTFRLTTNFRRFSQMLLGWIKIFHYYQQFDEVHAFPLIYIFLNNSFFISYLQFSFALIITPVWDYTGIFFWFNFLRSSIWHFINIYMTSNSP